MSTIRGGLKLLGFLAKKQPAFTCLICFSSSKCCIIIYLFLFLKYLQAALLIKHQIGVQQDKNLFFIYRNHSKQYREIIKTTGYSRKFQITALVYGQKKLSRDAQALSTSPLLWLVHLIQNEKRHPRQLYKLWCFLSASDVVLLKSLEVLLN